MAKLFVNFLGITVAGLGAGIITGLPFVGGVMIGVGITSIIVSWII